MLNITINKTNKNEKITISSYYNYCHIDNILM